MGRLDDLIACNEPWLAERVLSYVRRSGFPADTPTLEEEWRASIAGLSASLLLLSKGRDVLPETFPEEDLSPEPASAFGALEARRHRDLGVDLRLSLGLLKHIRRCFVDLVCEAGFSREEEESCRRHVERFFDRVEEAFLLERERAAMDEKSRYLKFFDCLPGPAFLFDENGRVENMNRTAAAMLGEDTVFGEKICGAEWRGKPIPLLADELAKFRAADVASRSFEKAIDASSGRRHCWVEMHRMPRICGKPGGTSVFLTDLTRRWEAEETLQVVLEEMEERIRERTAEVARSHNMLNAIISNTTDAIFLKDLEGRYVMVNPAAAMFLGRPAEEVVGKSDLDLSPTDYTRALMEKDLEIIRSGETRTCEEVLDYGGTTRSFSAAKGPYRDGDGRIIGLFGISRDITAQKLEEEALRKVNRALRMMWEFARSLVRAKDEAELYSGVCRIVVEEGGYRLAWIGIAENDPARTVRPVAQFGFEEGYLQTLSLTWSDAVRGRGPTGTSIRTMVPVVARDILTDPNFEPWRAEALRRGYASTLSLPFGERMGALTVYSPKPDAFDTEEVRLLTEFADMLGYGIRSLRAEADRRKTVDTPPANQ